MLKAFRQRPSALPTFGDPARPFTVQRMARARAMRLRVDPRDGAIRLTIPARAALAPALAWVETQRPWIEAQLAALPANAPIGPSTIVPFEGGRLLVDWRPDAPRAVRREGDLLVVGGGPVEALGPRILRWLAREALATLDTETRACAACAGVAIGRVGVGDPRSRWGSCSAAGDIRYSWRLILAPPAVRRATVAHEVAHRLHMDHSPDFHAAVERLFGANPSAERTWLRRNGATLQRFGRSS